MKVVADTMIWVSYCTNDDGFRHRVIERAYRQRVRFFVSEYILQELAETLVDDLDFSTRFSYFARRAVLRRAKEVVLPRVVGSFVPGDVKDNPIVQTALTAKSDYLVTADKVILRLHKVRDVEVISLDRFESLLKP
jgi:putative PIN family toxin of toxin-antitoxin system